MIAYRFTATNGKCPSCIAFGRKWYIQDRNAGGGEYEYCLMSVSTEPSKMLKFKSKKEVAEWLNDTHGIRSDDIADYIISTKMLVNYQECVMLEKNDRRYRFHKKTNTLTELKKSVQETGYFERYNECLRIAKEILEKKEKLQYEQMTFVV